MDSKVTPTTVRQLSCEAAQRLSENVRAGMPLSPEEGHALSEHMSKCNSEIAHK